MQTPKSQYLNAGAFAKLAGVNKKTLHYYDEIELFQPAYVNEHGYRFYSIFQLDRLALILILKDSGVALKDIKQYLDGGDARQLDQSLMQTEQELDRQIHERIQRKKLLQDILSRNQAYLNYMGQGYQRLHQKSETCEPLFYFDREHLKEKDKSPILLVNYITDGPHTGLCITPSKMFLYRKCQNGSHSIPEGDYLCLFGEAESGLEQRTEQVEKMKAYALANQISLADEFFMEFNDILLNPDKKDYFCIRSRILEM